MGVVFSLTACEPVPSMPLTAEEKRVDMDWMYTQFEKNYAPLDYKQKLYGFEYQALKKYYTERAMATATNDEFYQLMHQFVAQFKDAHTTAALTHGGLKGRAKLAYLGISGRRQGDVFVVTEFLPTFDAKKSNFPIKIGDEISMLDGKALPTIIREELVKYEDIGQDSANLTFHMNRLFNRVSTSMPLPTKADAVITIVRREYTAEEKKEIEEKTGSPKAGEKKTVHLNVTLPWIVKDLFDFRQDQKIAKAEGILNEAAEAEVDGQEDGEDESFEVQYNIYSGRPAHRSSIDVFDLNGDLGDGPLVFGLKGFDGSIQFPSEVLSRVQRGSKHFHYLNSFFIPNQVESWTVDLRIDENGLPSDTSASVLEQMKKVRFVPNGARFITKDDATFPTYITKEKVGENRTRLVATMFLSTFSPKAKEGVVMKEVRETLDHLQFLGVNDLIIDTINNGGGSLSLGMQLAQALSNKKVEMPKMQFVLSQTWLDDFENASLNSPSESERELSKRVFEKLHAEKIGGKRLSSPFSTESLVPFALHENDRLERDLNIVVLVNEMCASMCDIFAGIMQDNHLATIVGSKTMGAGGNVVAHYSAPNSHLVLRQTESLMIRTDGKSSYIENNGIEPNVAVDVNLAVSGKYRSVLQAGMKALLGKVRVATVAPAAARPAPASGTLVRKRGRRAVEANAEADSRGGKWSRSEDPGSML
jgi:C-terminal processing protease CtpA/Prc